MPYKDKDADDTCKKKWKLARLASGLCPYCPSGVLLENRKRCAKCMAKSREAHRERVRRGLCHFCSKPREDGKSLCSLHLERREEKYKEKRRLGACTACREAAVPGWTKCQEHLDKERSRYRLRNYGISKERFSLLFNNQNGSCGICLQPFVGQGAAHVDHVHGTGEIRGLLCFSCNIMLGNSGDSPTKLLAAVDYLKNPPGLVVYSA